MNYRDWIRHKANEIADEEYDGDFCDLPSDIQVRVWNRAVQAWKDYMASKIDALYDKMRELHPRNKSSEG